jgi:hypothetical protein
MPATRRDKAGELPGCAGGCVAHSPIGRFVVKVKKVVFMGLSRQKQAVNCGF